MSVFVTILCYVSANLLGCYFGWLTIFRTGTAASRAYSKYGFNFFLKPWYSIFLRCMGIIVLLLMAVSDDAEVALRYGYL
jgi:hypothetical protein